MHRHCPRLNRGTHPHISGRCKQLTHDRWSSSSPRQNLLMTKLDCPLILLAGRHDRSVNSQVAHEWFERIQSPLKCFVSFEHSADEVMVEEPRKLLVTLVTHARPIRPL